MELNRISSFKSFSELKKQQEAVKTEQDNKSKRVKSLEKISAILDELEISDMSELDEEKKKALVAKIFNEDRAEEIEDEIVAMGKEKDAVEDVLNKVEEDRAEEIEDKIKDLGEPEKEDADDAEDVQTDLYEATVTLDAMEPDEKSLVAFCKKHGIKWKIVNMTGPAGGWPEVEYVGKKKDLEKMIKTFWEGDGEDSGLAEFIEESSIFEAIKVEGKRDAGKVVTAYNRIFGKMLTDLGAMNIDSKIGCIKYLYTEAMIDANFGREGEFAASNIKGNIATLPIKMNGLGGHFVKIGATTIRTILDNYATDISGAASWRGIGITEGTALFLAQLGQEAVGQALLNAFNSQFAGESVRVDITAKLNESLLEAKAKGLDWCISELGDKPSCNDVAEFVYDNYDKVTGLRKSMRNDEMDFPEEIMDVVDHYGLDIDEFTECYGMAAESLQIDEARSINKIQNEWSKITAEMAAKAQEWKAAAADDKAKILDELKALTGKKKSLEAELDTAVAGKDKDLELAVSEGNAFTGALFAARNKGEKTFEFNGKTYKVIGAKTVNEDDEEVKEGNAFGDAVRKAKEEGKDEFEFQGKTYKVEEGNAFGDAVRKAKEEGKDEFEFQGKTYKVEEHLVEEGAVKQFEMDYKDMENSIKRGIGWIDPEYVADTWENSSDSIDFELVSAEIYKRLIKAGLLWTTEDGETQDKQVKSLRELGIKESIDESVISEAEIASDDEFKEYAFNVLQKAFGEDFDAEKAQEVVDGILKKCGDDYGACVGTLTSSLGESYANEGIDVDYWADYNTDTSGHSDPSFADKSKNFAATFKLAVDDWNNNNEMGEENEVTPVLAKKIEKIAKEFFKKTGWISVNVVGAMIAQEAY